MIIFPRYVFMVTTLFLYFMLPAVISFENNDKINQKCDPVRGSSYVPTLRFMLYSIGRKYEFGFGQPSFPVKSQGNISCTFPRHFPVVTTWKPHLLQGTTLNHSLPSCHHHCDSCHTHFTQVTFHLATISSLQQQQLPIKLFNSCVRLLFGNFKRISRKSRKSETK